MIKAENATAKTGCCSGGHNHSGHGHSEHHADGHKAVRDPVCGMSVDPATGKHRVDFRGETHHFCSAGCRTKFAADPARYLGGKDMAPVPGDAVYTCPMHPEIVRTGPGACPICGMALEPRAGAVEEGAAEAPVQARAPVRRRAPVAAPRHGDD